MMRNGKSTYHLGHWKQNKDGSRDLQVNCKEGLCVARAQNTWQGRPGAELARIWRARGGCQGVCASGGSHAGLVYSILMRALARNAHFLSFAETEPQNIGVSSKSVLLWDRTSKQRLEG